MTEYSKHPKSDLVLEFDSDNHVYRDNTGRNYTSVTTFISRFFEVFDTETIAARCAVKRNVSAESLKNEWKRLGDEAADLGHIVHSAIANKFKNKEIDQNEITNRYSKQLELIYENISKQCDVIYIEEKIFSPTISLAGTCDAVFITKDKSKYIIVDWKTNKKIDQNNDYNKRGFGILNFLPDCNYSHYSLQLQLYKYILKHEGYLPLNIPISCKLVHITPYKSRSYDIRKIEVKKLLEADETLFS